MTGKCSSSPSPRLRASRASRSSAPSRCAATTGHRPARSSRRTTASPVPLRPADPGHGAVGEVRQQHRRDLGVVVEHLALGGAGAAGRAPCRGCDQLQGAAVDVDVDLVRWHRHPSAHRSSGAQVGADAAVRRLAQPAVGGAPGGTARRRPPPARTHTVPCRVDPAGRSSERRVVARTSGASRSASARPALPAMPLPTRPRYVEPVRRSAGRPAPHRAGGRCPSRGGSRRRRTTRSGGSGT